MPHPIVYLVGAGPGDPGLLTCRGVECLAQADVILYDRLVSPRILENAPAQAERISVALLSKVPTERRQRLHDVLIEKARSVNCVVRLMNGDPFIFGRAGEESQWLRDAGIHYEIVPGVSAGLAAAAYVDIPLTHWSHPSGVALLSGFDDPERLAIPVDWDALARFPGTLVFYKGLARLREASEMLMQFGRPAKTPAIAIQSATTGDQKSVHSTLDALHEDVLRAGLSGPAVVLVGPIIDTRQHPSWFESKPLFGKRVLITRPVHQAGPLARKLELLGAVPMMLPALDIREPEDWGRVDRVLGRLAEFDWLVFTSANGVQFFLQRLIQSGRDLRCLGALKLAAIGPATAARLADFHLNADAVPASYRSEDLALTLKPLVGGKRVLLLRADRGREVLAEQLSGVAEVETVAVYRQVDHIDREAEALNSWRRGEIDFVLVTSSNIVRSIAGHLDDVCRQRVLSGDVRFVSISPVTSSVLTELELPIAAEATEYTMDGVVAALVKLTRA